MHTCEAGLCLITFHQPVLHKQASTAPLLIVECELAGHGRHVVLSVGTYESATQSVHSPDPELALYLPDAHDVQIPLDPVQPALHEHAVMLLLPDTEIEFAGQSVQ